MGTTPAVASIAENKTLGDLVARGHRIAGWMLLIGALASAAVSLWHAGRFWAAYLVAFTFVTGISLGALFFVIVQHLVRAGWSVTVRRVAEGIALNLRFVPLLFLPLLFPIVKGDLLPAVYKYRDAHAAAHAEPGHGDGHGAAAGHGAGHGAHAEDGWHAPHLEGVVHAPMSDSKMKWLSLEWVIGRYVIYFVAWFLMASFFHRTSVKQDATKDPGLTARMQAWSAPCMIVFALTTTFFAFDTLMALDPYWYSTMFGVYFFAGCLVSFFAALSLTLWFLQRNGRIAASVTPEHYHDVGKFMFAFIVFWAYVAYSQYMLIWYANIPEETQWFLIRQAGDWKWVGLTLVFFHFALPFLLLLSRFPKRRPTMLVAGAVYMLVLHFVDLYYIAIPQLSPLGRVPVPLLDAFLLLAFMGLWVFFTTTNLKGASLVPQGDPRLGEALAHENY